MHGSVDLIEEEEEEVVVVVVVMMVVVVVANEVVGRSAGLCAGAGHGAPVRPSVAPGVRVARVWRAYVLRVMCVCP